MSGTLNFSLLTKILDSIKGFEGESSRPYTPSPILTASEAEPEAEPEPEPEPEA